MKPTEDGFRAWLEEYNLQPPSIESYVSDVRVALGRGGVMKRLRDEELAPKTRRRALAACRKWAEYTGDVDLARQLKRIRLPPPRRAKPKLPLTREQYDRLVDEIGRATYVPAPIRAVLGILASRGLRCGDALRLKRTELDQALDTGILSHVAKGQRRLEFRVLSTFRRSVKLLAAQEGTWSRVDQLVAPGAKPRTRRGAAAKAVQRALVRVGVRCGVYGSLHPHQLRRTYAVEYLRGLAGDPEALIKLTEHMGWASMQTAMEYVNHARGSELDHVAERVFARGKKTTGQPDDDLDDDPDDD